MAQASGTDTAAGATRTNPKEDLVVVWMAPTPGPMRWKYRQMINALVYQAIAD